jgi:hypothetical protein
MCEINFIPEIIPSRVRKKIKIWGILPNFVLPSNGFFSLATTEKMHVTPLGYAKHDIYIL